MRRLALLAALVALPACDLVTADAVSTVSSADLNDLESLTSDYFSCDARVRSETRSARGTLESGDCLQTDDSYQDFYAFVVDEPATVTVSMTSSDLAPYLFLLSADLGDADPLIEVARDRNEGRTDRAEITARLPAGLYLVYANSVDPGETGDYTLTIESDVAGDVRGLPAGARSAGAK